MLAGMIASHAYAVLQVVERHDSAHLRELLRHKCVPVIHGDVVMDSVQGASVLGGDLLMRILSTTLRCVGGNGGWCL